jgi:hypothetical protein
MKPLGPATTASTFELAIEPSGRTTRQSISGSIATGWVMRVEVELELVGATVVDAEVDGPATLAPRSRVNTATPISAIATTAAAAANSKRRPWRAGGGATIARPAGDHVVGTDTRSSTRNRSAS